jgi:hypothetical protein
VPVTIRKRGNAFQVATPSGVKAKGTTKPKALAQERLLNAVDQGWQPTRVKTQAKRVTGTSPRYRATTAKGKARG